MTFSRSQRLNPIGDLQIAHVSLSLRSVICRLQRVTLTVTEHIPMFTRPKREEKKKKDCRHSAWIIFLFFPLYLNGQGFVDWTQISIVVSPVQISCSWADEMDRLEVRYESNYATK